MRLPSRLLCLTLSLLPSTLAVYADDAYNVDYHHELLGVPQAHTTFFHRPRKDDKATLLYTLSDLGVLGAVNPGSGKVIWRQFLGQQNATGPGVFLRPVEGESTVVSAVGRRIDAWDATNGKQRWGNIFDGKIKDLEVAETLGGGDNPKDVLALFEENGKSLLRRVSGATGNVAWEYKDWSDDLPLQASTTVKNVYMVSLHGSWGGYNLKVTVLDPATGKKTNEYTLSSKADVHVPEDVLLVGANSASPIIAWTDKTMKNLKVNILGKAGSIQSLPLKDADGEIIRIALHAPHLVQSLPHFLVHSFSAVSNRADVYHIDLASGSIRKEYELPKLPGSGAVSTSSQDANVYFTRITEDEVFVVASTSHGILSRWPVTVSKNHGDFVHGVSEVVKKTGNTYAVRSAVFTSEEDWVLVRNGAEAWTRVEGLSGAISAAWAEIPESETLAKTLEAEAHSNPLSAYIHRVKRHINDLQYLPAYLQELPTRLLSSILPGDNTSQAPGTLVRDSFGFNKLVIVSTQRGRVYCIDAGNQGAVVWTVKGFDIPANQKFEVQSTWVDNDKSLATVRGANGESISINTVSGSIVKKSPPASATPGQSTVVVSSPGGKWSLNLNDEGYPGKIEAKLAPNAIIVIKGKNDEVRGFKFIASGEYSVPVVAWTFQPSFGQSIINIVTKSTHDPIASIGRVLGDRTVLYKYLNPNVVLVTTASEEASTASLYLLDSVSGEILHAVSHEGVDARQPITSVLTENWFAYSLWSDLISTSSLPGSKGNQLIVAELFESDVPNYRGPLGSADNSSSLEPSDVPNADPPRPFVMTQSFLIPESVSYMTVTQTLQGITARQLLCVLDSQNAILGIPRTVLDPRRPVGRDPTAAEAEEGLFRYSPVIELEPKMVVTHKREVLGIRDIITTPALLESTSLVFAYGVDVFGTRVAPSAAFDYLGKGFGKLSLVSTVLGLAVGVAVLAPMVRRKQIDGRWITS